MDPQLIVTIVGSLGFPIAVATWFMAREPRITNAIEQNTAAINSLLMYLGGGKRPPGGDDDDPL